MRRGGRILMLAAMAALALAAALGIVGRNVMVVKDIQVTGVDEAAARHVRELAGLRLGESIFGVDAAEIAANLRADGYIKLCGVEVVRPDRVIISVEERTPAAAVEHLGFSYLVDAELSVLEVSNGQTDFGVPVVRGANMQNTPVGMALNIEEGQRELAMGLIGAVYGAGIEAITAEIDMSDSQNISLKTRSGYIVMLGDRENMAQKLALVGPVEAQLRLDGRASGTVDVSSARFADYIPPSGTPEPTLMPGAAAPATSAPSFVPYATPAA